MQQGMHIRVSTQSIHAIKLRVDSNVKLVRQAVGIWGIGTCSWKLFSNGHQRAVMHKSIDELPARTMSECKCYSCIDCRGVIAYEIGDGAADGE